MKHLIGKKLFDLVLCAFTKSSKEKDTFRENLLIRVHLRNKRTIFKKWIRRMRTWIRRKDLADLADSDFNAHLDSLGFLLKRVLLLLLLVVFYYLTEG